MGEDVDEVDDEHVKRGGVEAAHLAEQTVGGWRVAHFVVGERFAAAEAFELFGDEAFLVLVFAFVLLFVDPQVGIEFLDLQWHESGEQRVAGVLRRCGQDAVVQVFVDGEVVAQLPAQQAPLVQPEVVEHQNEHLLPRVEQGEHLPAEHVGAHQWALVGMGHPVLVVGLDEAGERAVGLFLLHQEHFAQCLVGRLAQFQFPVNEPFVKLCPFRGVECFVYLCADASEVLPVAAHGGFGHDFLAVYVFFQGQQDLARVDRFDEVVGNFRADCLVHDVLFLAFGHHDDGHVGPELLDLRQGLEAAESGHVLVEQDEVEIFLAATVYGVGAVRGGHYVVVLFGQEEDVRAEHFDLVVHPQEFAVRHWVCASLLGCEDRQSAANVMLIVR